MIEIQRRTKFGQSGSGNVAVMSDVIANCYERSCSTDPEHREGYSSDSAAVKNKVMGFQNDRNPAKDKIWAMRQVRLLLWVSPHSSLGLFPGFLALPVPPSSLCFVFSVGVVPNQKIP